MLALIAIAPDHPDVQAAVTEQIRAEYPDPVARGSAARALEELFRLRPRAEWVRALALPALCSPDHPLHAVAIARIPAEAADLLDVVRHRLEQELTTTTERDLDWAFAAGRGPESHDLWPKIAERDRTNRVARALSLIPVVSASTVDAFVARLRSDVLESPKPPKYGEYPAGDRRASVKKAAWDWEQGLATNVAFYLATLLDREPAHFARVVEGLAAHPVALALVLSSTVEPHPAHALRIPADLKPDAAKIALDSLLANVKKAGNRQYAMITFLGRLPTDDPRRNDVLLDFVRFGPGRSPSAALIALGHASPVTPGLVEIIREHLSDARPAMRAAAIAAAGNAGEAAKPLLDDLLELARKGSFEHDVVAAIVRIAPADRRVLSIIEDYRAKTSRRVP